MASKYCEQCPKAARCSGCPILNRMHEANSPLRAGFYGITEGLLPEYGERYSLNEILAIRDCPFVNPLVEQAIIETMEEEDMDVPADFLFTSRGPDHVICHVHTHEEKRSIQQEQDKKKNDFEELANRKLEAAKASPSGSSHPGQRSDRVDFELDLTRVYEFEEVCDIFTAHIKSLPLNLSKEIAALINIDNCFTVGQKFFKFTKDSAGQLHIVEVTDFESVTVEGIIAPPPAEGSISYAKAVKIAFDTATPDKYAKQFAEVLSDAKHWANEVAQPITMFAHFKVKPNGELTFNCPTEYDPKIKIWEVKAILRDKFNVISWNGKYVSQMTNETEIRELLKRVRAGNFEGCKVQDGRSCRAAK